MPNPPWRLNTSEMARIKRLTTLVGECWVWKGSTTPNGYGKHRVGPGKRERVIHRIVWEHHNDCEVPKGMQLDHLCRNRLCCNPEHLEAVSGSENTMRQDHANRRKEACPRGHEYDDETTRMSRSGRRVCRVCDRERKRSGKLSVTSAASLEHAASVDGGAMGPPGVGGSMERDRPPAGGSSEGPVVRGC